jgi:hypothetical protein
MAVNAKCEQIDPRIVADTVVDQLRENMLDDIFGFYNRKQRRDFVNKLKSSHNNWLLESQSIRNKIQTYCKKQQIKSNTTN